MTPGASSTWTSCPISATGWPTPPFPVLLAFGPVFPVARACRAFMRASLAQEHQAQSMDRTNATPGRLGRLKGLPEAQAGPIHRRMSAVFSSCLFLLAVGLFMTAAFVH